MSRITWFFLAVLASACMPLRLPAQPPERFALVIGVAGYPGYRPETRLMYADSDAVRFHAYLVDPAGGGFRPENVQLVTNQGVTRDSIATLVRWLARNVRHTDELYVFFSGHTKEELGKVYFMPYDAREDNAAGQGWEAGQFWDMFRSLPRRFLVMFVDACQAASLVDPNARGSGGGDDLLRTLNAALAGQPPQDIALLSSAGPQLSFEDPELRGGLFTHYLLQALRGAANLPGNGNGDSIVTVREAMRYVVDSVEARSLDRFKVRQSPQYAGGAPSFPLAAVVPPPQMHGTRSAADEIHAGDVSVYLRDFAAARRHFEAALALDPANSHARNRLAYSYVREERYPEALAAYREASERDPQNFIGRRSWGEVAMLLGDTAQALGAYADAAVLDPDDPLLLDDLSIALARREPLLAFRYAAAGVRLAPDNAHLRHTFGNRLSEAGQRERAIEQWIAATQLDRGHVAVDAYKRLSVAYLRIGELNRGMEALHAAAALLQDGSMARGIETARAITARHFQAREDSVRRWRAGLQASPRDRVLARDLTRWYGNWMFMPDSALAAAQRWRIAHPDDAVARVEVGMALLGLGRYAESRAVLDSARGYVSSVPDRIGLEAVSLAADYGLGDDDRAVARLQVIRGLLSQRPDRSAGLDWIFTGVRHHVRESPVLEPYRYGLLAFFEALDLPAGREMEHRVGTLQITASPDSP